MDTIHNNTGETNTFNGLFLNPMLMQNNSMMNNMNGMGNMNNMNGMGNMNNINNMGYLNNMNGIGNMNNINNMGYLNNMNGIGNMSNINNMENLNNMNNMGNLNNMNNMGNLNNMNNMGNLNNMNNMGNLNNMNINNVIMNIKNQNMYMLKQIETNNKILDMIMNNNPQFQNQNNLQQNSNDSNINKLQNRKKSVKVTPLPLYSGQRISIIFEDLNGNVILIHTPIIMKVSELLNEFLRNLGLSEDIKSIHFLTSGQIINRKENRTVIEYGLMNGSRIVVLDSNNIIGG